MLPAIFVLCVLSLLVTAGCYTSRDPNIASDQSIRDQAAAPARDASESPMAQQLAGKTDVPSFYSKDLLGNAACAPCHPSQFRDHHDSRHAMTVRPGDAQHLGTLTPPTGSIGDSGYSIAAQGTTRYLTQDGQIAHGQPLQYALGAGKSGMTYVRVLGPDNLIAMKLSYFPGLKAWYPTPVFAWTSTIMSAT